MYICSLNNSKSLTRYPKADTSVEQENQVYFSSKFHTQKVHHVVRLGKRFLEVPCNEDKGTCDLCDLSIKELRLLTKKRSNADKQNLSVVSSSKITYRFIIGVLSRDNNAIDIQYTRLSDQTINELLTLNEEKGILSNRLIEDISNHEKAACITTNIFEFKYPVAKDMITKHKNRTVEHKGQNAEIRDAVEGYLASLQYKLIRLFEKLEIQNFSSQEYQYFIMELDNLIESK